MTPERERIIEQQFDAFCKKVIRNTAANYTKALRKHIQQEIPFADLVNEVFPEPSAEDSYDLESKLFLIPATNNSVIVRDGALIAALDILQGDIRQIVLLSYFMGLSNSSIAKLLKISPSTVAKRKKKAVRTLREIMEGLDHER